MSIAFMFILQLALVALVAAHAIYVFSLPAWADNILLGGLAGAAAVVLIAIWSASARQRAAYVCLQILGMVALVVAAAALAAPAWQVLVEPAATTLSAGRMAPMFVAALALYGANLWLDLAHSAAATEPLHRLTKLTGGPKLLPALITALLLTAGLILAMDWAARAAPAVEVITKRFLRRGIIPPITVLLFFWGVLLLFAKQWNTAYVRRGLRRWRYGKTGGLADSIDHLAARAGGAKNDMELLWQRYEESYLLPKYISWAVPVLGFIGTVLGISLAADGIRRIIGSDSGLAGLSGDLSGAIAPLGIAFDTTLIALSLSVVLTLLLALAQRGEERALADLEWEIRNRRRGRAESQEMPAPMPREIIG